MAFPVYDYRRDIRNLLVTPQIRARFERNEPAIQYLSVTPHIQPTHTSWVDNALHLRQFDVRQFDDWHTVPYVD